MAVVNNVTRLLDAKKVNYTAFETPVEKLGAVETAIFLNIPLETVYKTVVLTRPLSSSPTSVGKSKPILAVVPGTHRVDLKMLASALDEKKVVLPTEREAERLTGLQAGGISPLALINRGFTVVIEESAKAHGSIHISGGQRGLNIRLTADDLASLTHARFARISVPDT